MSLFENQKSGFPAGKKYVKDLRAGEKTRGYFKVMSVSKRNKRDGNPFLMLELMDKTGKIPAKIWNNADHYFSLVREGSIYKIDGYVNEYMSQKEIKVDDLRAVSPSDRDFEEADFIENAAFDTGKMYRDMMETIGTHISDPHLEKLIDLFDKEYGEAFKIHYGAQKVHHAYIGGLLQHTCSMVGLAVHCAGHYGLDKELLLVGVLFHDIGKLFEFDIAPTVSTTLEGGLLGHITIGCAKFQELTGKIPGFPEELSGKIRHLIVSHHGEKEFGSPEVPKTAEAYVLNILDLLDSRMNIIEGTLAGIETHGLFSEYIKVLGRRLYVPPGDRESEAP